MLDWCRKQIKKFREKRREKKQAKKEAKKQKAEEKPYVERDYLAEWNAEHPEEFMDLRLRTIEDEMADRALLEAQKISIDKTNEADGAESAADLQLLDEITVAPDAEEPCSSQKASCVKTPNAVPMKRSASVRLTRGDSEQDLISNRMNRGLLLFGRNDAIVTNNAEMGYVILYDTFLGLEVKTDNELYKPWEDNALFGNDQVQRCFSTPYIH